MTHDRAINQPNIRIDVGSRLKAENGHKLETLCVIDTNPQKNQQYPVCGCWKTSETLPTLKETRQYIQPARSKSDPSIGIAGCKT